MKDLSLHILDIIQNSISAKANLIELTIEENLKDNLYTLTFIDNGMGMSDETAKKVVDPYFTSRTTRKVGLGLPLLKQNAERTGGNLTITSKEGCGTTVKAVFQHNSIDRPVLGDIAGVIVLLCSANPEINFVYRHITESGEYIFDSREIKETLEGVSISNPDIMKYLKEMIKENLLEINTND